MWISFNQTRLGTKLALGFSGLIALILILGAISWVAQSRALRAVDTYLAREAQIAELGANSEIALLQARRLEAQFGQGSKPSPVAAPAQAVDALLAAIAKNIAAIRPLSNDPQIVGATQQIDRSLSDYGRAYRRAIDLNARAADGADAETLRAEFEAQATIIRSAGEALEHSLNELRAHASTGAVATHDTLLALNRSTDEVIIGAVLAAIVLGAAISVFIGRSVGRSVRRIVEFAQRLSAGDWSARIVVRGSNEFAVLGGALNGMVEALRRGDREKVAQATILERLNRTLRLLSQGNNALVRATSESELVTAVTGLAVEVGGYRLAWVGYALQDQAYSVQPVAFAGVEDGYLQGLGITWADNEAGNGPMGRTIRLGEPSIVHSIAEAPEFARRRDEALKRGFRSLAIFPLQHRDAVFGAIAFYSGEPEAFDEDEVKLLKELSEDLGYGIGALREAQAREQSERELDHRKHHDALTGLANRELFRTGLREATVQAARNGELLAVMSLGLDRFRTINDGLGHAAGDEVLMTVGKRLRTFVHAGETAARLGGDRFALVLSSFKDKEEIVATARQVLARVTLPITLDGHEVHPGASMGISLFPEDSADFDAQLRNAEMALHTAKEMGGGMLRFFAPEMNARAGAEFGTENDLRRALERDELLVYYQPRVSLLNGEITGAEALLRWNHPVHGFVPPGQFIAVAEDTGLIEPLSRWVIEAVCRQIRAWRTAGLSVPTVAVNISARQFRKGDLVDIVQRQLRAHQLEGNALEIELTESTVMQDLEAAIVTLQQLKKLGVRCALDDFGTGHSSLRYLRRLPIDEVKIDQSFVRDITGDPDNAAVCNAIIALGQQLKLTVVAEGVETQGQMNYLRRRRCDEIQGYFFSPAVASDEFEQFLRAGKRLVLPQADGERRTLLIVDDEPNVVSSLKRLLRGEGIEIVSATSAQEGFEVLAGRNIQVVLTDQRMPAMSGIEFLSRVRDLYPETVRLVLSGYTDLATVIEAVNRGTVYRFLTKPWEDALLKQHIREAFHYQWSTRSEAMNPPTALDNPPASVVSS